MNRYLKLTVILVLTLLSVGSLYGSQPKWKLDRAACMIDSGDKLKLTAKGDAPRQIVWSSDNTAVATVNSKGVVKAHSHGDAVITALCKQTGESAACIVSVDYEGQNPILPPTWGLYIADGEPHVFNGRMYLYGSKDCYNGFNSKGENGYCSEYYHTIWSDDLIHWNDAGESLDMNDIPIELLGRSKRLWAPDVFQCPVSKKYYMVTCTNGQKIFILESDSPEGPFTNPRYVTLNGEELDRIDPCVLVDDDQKVYIGLPKFIVAQLDPNDYSKILPQTVVDLRPSMPDDNEPFEGPSMRKRNGIYYYIYIQNVGNIKKDGACPTRMVYMTSRSPLGPYTYQGLVVTTYDYPATINVHGSIEPFNGEWYVAYHRIIPGLRRTRVPNFDKVTFNDDGTIRQVLMSSSGVKGSFSIDDRIQASSAVLFSTDRSNSRLRIRSEATGAPNEFKMTDYPYLSFDRSGQWALYRYMDFTQKFSSISFTLQSTKAGGVLELRKGAVDGELVATVDLPDTEGKWQNVVVSTNAIDNRSCDAFYLIARNVPSDSSVDVDYFSFKR